MVLCALSTPTLAQPAVGLSSASGHPGEQMEMAVQVQGLEQVTAVQISIPLPEGITYVENSATAGSDVVTASHQLQVTQTGQELKIYVYSLQLDALQGGQGRLLSFHLLAGGAPGTYPLQPAVVLSNAQGGLVTASVTAGSVTVLSPAAELSTKAIDFGQVPIRSTHTRSVVVTNTGNEPLSLTAAECSVSELSVSGLPCTIQPGSQKTLTISYAPQKAGEAEATVKIISDAANGTQTIRVKAQPYSVNELLVSTTAIGGDAFSVSVEMNNMEPIVAVQCTFRLPDALQFAEGSVQMNASRSNGHLLSSSCVDGTLKVYIHSASNAALIGEKGELFTFRVQSIGASGNYTLSPTEVALSNAAGENMLSGTKDATVHLSAPRIEAATQIDFGAQPMDKELRFSYPVRNAGETLLTISRIEIDNPAITVSPTLPLNIEAGATRNLEMVYRPEQAGAFEGIMQLYCNDPDQQMLVVNIAGSTYYDNQLSLSGMERDNGQYALTISLQNTLPIVALQADVHWAAGYTLRAEDISLSSRAGNHQVVLSQTAADTYRLFVYSPDNQPIAAGEGALLTLIYNKVETSLAAYGTMITVDHVILSTQEGKDQSSSSVTTMVVGKKGDVNSDGLVTVADVTAVVDVLLERQLPNIPSARADINGDGQVSIIDVVEAIQLVLNEQ